MGKKFWDRADSLLTERRIAIACGVLLAISLLPLAVISFYNHPCSDDYSYGLYVAQAVRAGGSLGDILAAAVRETAETYFDWQGTFSAVFLMALQPAAFGERFYAVTAYLMVGSLVFANFFFLKELCVHRLGMSRSSWVTISCALCFFMVHFAPSAFEGFFWYNGSLFYTFFHGLALCLFTFLSKFLRASSAARSLICGVVSAILAFIVSRKRFLFKRSLSLFWVITMYVNGGMIPVFLLYKNLGLTNSFWVYVIPGMVSAFNMLVIRTYMAGIPDSLEESAQLDGAGYMTIFLKIISPLCKPVYATVALFVAVGQWNSWFDAMLYNRMSPEFTTLQYELMKLLSSVTNQGSSAEAMKNAIGSVTPTSVRAAATILTMLPIICLYPFLQRYFVTGLTIGGVKE